MRLLTSSRRWLFGALPLAVVASCAPAGQEPVEFELQIAGTEPTTSELSDGTQLVLEQASVAFGPLYLCPGRQAGALCETARAEWLDSAVLDALDPTPRGVGNLLGLSGAARSYMYDLGFSSLLTRQDAVESEAAAELDGASIVLRGEATLDPDGEERVIPFEMQLVVRATEDTERGYPVVRSNAQSGFSLDLDQTTSSLTVRFDATEWVTDLTASDFETTTSCDDTDSEIVCNGQLAETCATGEVVDCRALGMICSPREGCAERLVFSSDDSAQRKVLGAVVAGARPSFVLR